MKNAPRSGLCRTVEPCVEEDPHQRDSVRNLGQHPSCRTGRSLQPPEVMDFLPVRSTWRARRRRYSAHAVRRLQGGRVKRPGAANVDYPRQSEVDRQASHRAPAGQQTCFRLDRRDGLGFLSGDRDGWPLRAQALLRSVPAEKSMLFQKGSLCASNTHLLPQWISITSESRSGAQGAGAAFQTWRSPSRVQKRPTRGNGCKSILIILIAPRNCRKLKLNRTASAFPEACCRVLQSSPPLTGTVYRLKLSRKG